MGMYGVSVARDYRCEGGKLVQSCEISHVKCSKGSVVLPRWRLLPLRYYWHFLLHPSFYSVLFRTCRVLYKSDLMESIDHTMTIREYTMDDK
jgi:hypothetical protein